MTERLQSAWGRVLVLCACALPAVGHAESAAAWDAGTACAQSRDCPCGYYCLSGSCGYRDDPSGLSCAGDLDCGSRCSAARCVGNVCVVLDAGPAGDLGGDALVDVGHDASPPDDRGTVAVDAGVLVDAGHDASLPDDRGTVAVDAGALVDAGAPPPPPDNDSGCSVRGGRGGRGGVLWGGLVAVAALGLRRRRRCAGDSHVG